MLVTGPNASNHDAGKQDCNKPVNLLRCRENSPDLLTPPHQYASGFTTPSQPSSVCRPTSIVSPHSHIPPNNTNTPFIRSHNTVLEQRTRQKIYSHRSWPRAPKLRRPCSNRVQHAHLRHSQRTRPDLGTPRALLDPTHYRKTAEPRGQRTPTRAET